ncbi:hypothetical protein MMC17_007926 [Xylographa soralifera]|nr:hypothetical protein [Xylographa soralifera]
MCKFYDFFTPCPRPWNCPHASSSERRAHWLNHCQSRQSCPVYIEHTTRLEEDVDLNTAQQAWATARHEHFSARRGLPELALGPEVQEGQRAERTERLTWSTERLQITGHDFKTLREKTSTWRFIWEALAGLPQYPAYVLAGMIFRELLAYVPPQFPVFVLWRMWEGRGEWWRERQER